MLCVKAVANTPTILTFALGGPIRVRRGRWVVFDIKLYSWASDILQADIIYDE